MVMTDNSHFPLFETKKAKCSIVYKLFAVSNFVGIIFIWVYRATHIAGFTGVWKLGWIGMFGAELWFGFYSIFTQALRWNRVNRKTFIHRLSDRYENELPGVDIFVCTADPKIEPPMLVINTVLSVMAYDYPTEKLSVYLSDDGGSDLTFYSLLEASHFARHWLPYCKKFKVEPRSPEAYFRSQLDQQLDEDQIKSLASIKKLYEDMENRIELAEKLNRVSRSALLEHKGFSKWDEFSSRGDHDAILQILIDGRDAEAKDVEGCKLPTLVYLAREKRPQYFHNFKAGALNALIRVSSRINNGPIILTVDCDMYSNNSQSIRDALCFFMDEEKGHEIAYVQFPQNFYNITKNELYGGSLRVLGVEFHGLDGYGGPMYVGTGCFHRRDSLCGRKFPKGSTIDWNTNSIHTRGESVEELEERVKVLASCKFEENTQWGNEMGLKYGCPVEDVLTGLSIQCRGWKSVYFNPKIPAFLGVSAITLDQTLVQHKRWSEGDFQIFLSKYCPVWYGLGRIHFGLILGYLHYCLWSPNSFATLYYSIVPPLCLLKDISLFPWVTSIWFLPFVYVITTELIYSIMEFLWAGGTILGWWNEQRIWLYKRTSSYLFGFVDTIYKLLGFSNSGFIVSSKVADRDVELRYEQEKMEFGVASPMLIILSSVAMINLFCFVGMLKKMIAIREFKLTYETMGLQIFLCGIMALINLPLYNGLFFRRDNGKMPSSVTLRAVVFAISLCTCFAFL